MPDNTYEKDLAGVEDISFDTNRNNEQFNRGTSTGGSQSITKVNARHIPVTNALTFLGAESVEDFLSKIIAVLNVDGAQSEDPLVTADDAFVSDNLVLADGNTRKLKDAGVSLDDIITKAGNNLIIDGQFNHWDFGSGPFVTDGYTSTMARVDSSGGTFSATRESFAVGQSDVPGNPKYFHRSTYTSPTGSAGLLFRLKNSTTFSGEKVTFSIFLKANNIINNFFVQWHQDFGPGGSSAVSVNSDTFNVTTSWQEFTVSIDVLSVSGKTIGSDDFIQIGIFLPSGVSATVDYANISCVQGSSPFNGSWLVDTGERARINPYYQNSYSDGTLPGGAATSGAQQ